MPTDSMKKVSKECNYSLSEVEDKWKKAKKQAEKQDESKNYSYIFGIFKKMLDKECLEKLGWNKNESKEEYNMNKTDELLEKIDLYLINEKEDEENSKKKGKIDKKDLMEALKNAAKTIFDEVDEDKLEGIADDVMKRDDVKDTETAIQVAINMLRSEE